VSLLSVSTNGKVVADIFHVSALPHLAAIVELDTRSLLDHFGELQGNFDEPGEARLKTRLIGDVALGHNGRHMVVASISKPHVRHHEQALGRLVGFPVVTIGVIGVGVPPQPGDHSPQVEVSAALLDATQRVIALGLVGVTRAAHVPSFENGPSRNGPSVARSQIVLLWRRIRGKHGREAQPALSTTAPLVDGMGAPCNLLR